MRISVEPGDTGYQDDTRNIEVTLNGIVVEHVITADEELGFVLFYPTDENGDFIHLDNGRLVRQMKMGKVVIRER